MIPSQQVLYAVSWPKPYKISLDDYLKIKKKVSRCCSAN